MRSWDAALRIGLSRLLIWSTGNNPTMAANVSMNKRCLPSSVCSPLLRGLGGSRATIHRWHRRDFITFSFKGLSFRGMFRDGLYFNGIMAAGDERENRGDRRASRCQPAHSMAGVFVFTSENPTQLDQRLHVQWQCVLLPITLHNVIYSRNKLVAPVDLSDTRLAERILAKVTEREALQLDS